MGNMENNVSANISDLREIGRTVVSDKFPITTDSFWFALGSDVIVNPFDFVTVENVQNKKTVGIVKELQTVTIDGDHYNSILNGDKGERNPLIADTQRARQIQPVYEITAAKVDIMANTGVIIEETKDKISINVPLRSKRSVRFATEEEIIFVLGTPEMENPIPAGVIQTTNGLHVPVTLDITYLAGPDTAHVNASGVSGNQKTTYLYYSRYIRN